MITTSANYKTAIKAVSREIRAYLKFNGSTIYRGVDGLVSINWNAQLFDKERFCVNCANAAYIEAEMYGEPIQNLESAYVEAYIGVVLEYKSAKPSGSIEDDTADVEYVKLGRFDVTEVVRKNGKVMISAYDRMAKLSENYVTTVTPTDSGYSKSAIVTDIKNQCGLTWTQSFSGYVPEIVNSTMRDQLCWLYGSTTSTGQSLMLSRDGTTVISKVIVGQTALNYTIDESTTYLDGLNNQPSFTITSYTANAGENTYSYGSGAGVECYNPYITSTIASNTYNFIKNFSYTPMTLEFRGDPAIELGDILTVTSGNNSYSVVVMKMATVFNGGLKTTIYCYGNTEEWDAISNSPTGARIIRTEEMVRIEAARASEAEGELAASITTTAEGILSTVSENYETIAGAEQMQSDIDQNARDIALKVSTTDYNGETIIGKINLDPSSATIAASHINLQGAVSISSFNSATQAALVTNTAVKNQYYISTSSSSATGGTWADTTAAWSSGKYVWTRVVTTKTYADGTSTTTNGTAVYDANLTTSLSTGETAIANAAIVNILPSVYRREATSGSTWTYNGITWVVNADGSVTASGTATGISDYTLSYADASSPVPWIPIDTTKKHTISGAPNTAGCYIRVTLYSAGGVGQATYETTTSTVIPAGQYYRYAYVYLRITSGTALPTGGVTFYPMFEVGDTAHAYVSTHNGSGAVNRQEQLIYRSAASGTTTMSGTTTWVTDVTGGQNTWTAVRPQYSQTYPVLFIATQRQTMGGTVTCTTPKIDETTTVIDGGHIITNSITADKINVSDLFSQNITATNFHLTGGSIQVQTSGANDNFIHLYTSPNLNAYLSASEISFGDVSTSDVFMNRYGFYASKWVGNTAYNNARLLYTGQLYLGSSDTGDPGYIGINSSTETTISLMGVTGEIATKGQFKSTKSPGAVSIAPSVAAFLSQTGANQTNIFMAHNSSTNNGIAFGVGNGGVNRGILDYKAGADNGWMIYFNGTNIYLNKPTDAVSTFNIQNSAQYPSLYFKSSDGKGGAQIRMFGSGVSVNGKYNMQRFVFREYSINSTSGSELSSYYEDYYLPVVTADRSSVGYYNILTSKVTGTLTESDPTTTTALASGTYKSCGSVSLSAGTWLVMVEAQFSANATGTRYLIPSYTADSSSTAVHWSAEAIMPAVTASGYATAVKSTFVAHPTSTSTVYFNCWQNSGSSLNVKIRYQIMRIL